MQKSKGKATMQNERITRHCNDIELRTTFNTDAEMYHSARPRYPEKLFDALIYATHLRHGAHLLEIGPATGQATVPLAERGYSVIAVEIGVDLAKFARRELKKYKNVEVLTGAFEDIELPPHSFDLIYAATAFHWIQPEFQFTKSHSLLKPDGHLAIIHTHHVTDDAGDKFHIASQPIYKRYASDRPKSRRDTRDGKSVRKSVADIKPEEVDETLFRPTYFKVFPMILRYSAGEYVKLLSTYSPTLAMDPVKRRNFLHEIDNLVTRDFGGILTKHYAISLTIAEKE